MTDFYKRIFTSVAVFLLFLAGLGGSDGYAQTKTVATYPTYQQTWNWWGCIAFNVQNTNPYPVKITGIRGTLGWNSYVEIWSSQTL